MRFMTRDRGPIPPVILLLSLLTQVGLHVWFPLATLIHRPWSWSGVAVILVGVGVIVSPALAFRRAGTTVIPFEESSSLVVSGMYRIARNPMYLGMVTILIGVAVLAGSLTPFVVPLVFVPIMNLRVIRHEESMLRAAFGDEYRAYTKKVRRWL